MNIIAQWQISEKWYNPQRSKLLHQPVIEIPSSITYELPRRLNRLLNQMYGEKILDIVTSRSLIAEILAVYIFAMENFPYNNVYVLQYPGRYFNFDIVLQTEEGYISLYHTHEGGYMILDIHNLTDIIFHDTPQAQKLAKEYCNIIADKYT